MTVIQGVNVRVRAHRFDRGRQGLYEVVTIDAGPPADVMEEGGVLPGRVVTRYPHRVEVYVSPSGRSVRVYFDGTEVRRGGAS